MSTYRENKLYRALREGSLTSTELDTLCYDNPNYTNDLIRLTEKGLLVEKTLFGNTVHFAYDGSVNMQASIYAVPLATSGFADTYAASVYNVTNAVGGNAVSDSDIAYFLNNDQVFNSYHDELLTAHYCLIPNYMNNTVLRQMILDRNLLTKYYTTNSTYITYSKVTLSTTPTAVYGLQWAKQSTILNKLGLEINTVSAYISNFNSSNAFRTTISASSGTPTSSYWYNTSRGYGYTDSTTASFTGGSVSTSYTMANSGIAFGSMVTNAAVQQVGNYVGLSNNNDYSVELRRLYVNTRWKD